MEKKSPPDFEVKRTILDPFEVEKKVIYPVADIYILIADLTILNVSPVALIVEEDGNRYVIQLTYKESDDDEFLNFLNKE